VDSGLAAVEAGDQLELPACGRKRIKVKAATGHHHGKMVMAPRVFASLRKVTKGALARCPGEEPKDASCDRTAAQSVFR
jgi:hypothetical protein